MTMKITPDRYTLRIHLTDVDGNVVGSADAPLVFRDEMLMSAIHLLVDEVRRLREFIEAQA